MTSWSPPPGRVRSWLSAWRTRLPWRRPGRPRRLRAPTILQMEAVECGAAALAMVLAAFGRLVPLEELRIACGVSRDGSKASNMLKAARTYGMTAKGFRKEPAQLRAMPMPTILHWNFNHFVVLEGFRRGHAYINDPAYGPKRITEEELDTAFTGVVLTFQPGPDFERKGKKRGLLSALLPRLRGSTVGLLFVVLAGFALLVPGMVVPTFSQVFVDDILVSGLTRWLRPLLILMGVTAAVQMALTWLQQRYLLRLETKLALSTSAKFLWHVLRLPIDFFNQRYAGEISNRVGINDKLAILVSGELATTVLNIVVIAFYAVLMFQYDVVLTLVSVLIAGLNLLMLKVVSRRRSDLSQRLQQDHGKLMGIAMGGLQTVETLKANGSEGDFFSRFAGYYTKVINSGQQFAVATHLLLAVPPLLLAINTAVLLGLGGLRVMDGHLSMGMLMAFQALMLAFIMPVNSLVNLGGTLQEVEADLNRVDDVLRAEPTTIAIGPGSESTDDEMAELEGFLELRDVAFGYSRLEAPLIERFDLELRPGSRVALVGSSGCGKSTVARLVAGLYDPWQGEILFDGRRRSEVARQTLSQSLALVDQDIFLFEATIRDNLSLWDDTIREVDIVEAAKDAAIHDDLTTRPKGYESMVAEGGINFSGGQRQRLEIARALARNPSILILDEATSALDPTTEKQIDDALRRRGITCLLVAHRLSTIRDCDEIVVMEHGKIIERGTHATLIAQNGHYTRLISAG